MEKIVDNNFDVTFEFPSKPVPKTFGQFLYDHQTGQYMGRTLKNWGQLGLFYLVFYIGLAIGFAICMQGLLAVLNDQYPRYQLSDSIIGTNPGLGFRPFAEQVEKSGFIHFEANNETQTNYWINRINDFLEPYNNHSLLPGGGKNHVNCDFNQRAKNRNVCTFDLTRLEGCSVENGFGYKSSSPCVFIKLNRIYGWVPEYYDDVNALPAEMPADLVEHIKSLPEGHRKQVWMTCNGISPSDNEALGPVSYFPNRGLPSHYFPYTNQPSYLSPLVAVQFERPTAQRIIDIECRAWAKNINYVGRDRDRQGSTTFSILVD
ncbi:sodium/potassium-dependent ATPase beta-2 subunit [Culex quinquefasciatus]|uniref:Sodium/potassium-dependent ATPase beta-2 subunit n=1 Tax=Culex quinquefasciatus TaxID=7176 RepID=B0WIC3_CULQU|nr:sodium/potassium-dependent ATPase beta-2 subunit [Culex quinquefasciatus]|eukprot:XP_001848457.1 sodium/potassium-dependent ATPase beta-2 subunit [Culex quinquefasciatus]